MEWNREYFLYDNLPIYMFISFVLILTSIFIYIKLAFPFWNVQPVYHPYDFWRCLYRTPFQIYKRFHPKIKTKYCKPENVELVPFVDASIDEKKAFVNLIQCYSIPDENTMCMFHLENLEATFSGHLYGSYLSFYKEIYFTKKNEEVVKSEKPLGCISSRSGVLSIGSHKYAIYYMDFMTIARDVGSRDVAIYREMFETHIYKIGFVGWKESGDAISIWLFRRMGFLSGIVPFVRFLVREYEIPNNPAFFKTKYPEEVVLVEIHKGNIRKMLDGLDICRERFSIFCITDLANLEGLVRSGLLYVFILERKGDILGMYFFKDTRTRIEEVGSVLELVASVWFGGSVELFRNGFLGSIGEIVKKNNVYRRIRIDNLTDTGLLEWREWFCLGQDMGAYYLYNMVVPYSSSAFILF